MSAPSRDRFLDAGGASSSRSTFALAPLPGVSGVNFFFRFSVRRTVDPLPLAVLFFAIRAG